MAQLAPARAMTDYTVIIPARYDSSRLPGKVLLDIGGKPMLQRVWEAARDSSASAVVIATDDARIEAAASAFGASVQMTAASHKSGTDRVAEVAAGMDDDRIVVNMQGDEPLLQPQLLDQVAIALSARPQADIVTLAEECEDATIVADRAAVKVVRADNGRALYFSRAMIPWGETAAWLRHIGVYAYRASFLRNFVQLPVASLEACERLEQLRALQNGFYIHVDIACAKAGFGVDTQDDLDRVRALAGEC